MALTEVHTDGLITSDTVSRNRVGRLADKVPSLEDGSISFLPDWRMRVVFNLRRGVTWHDGAPFTAQDLVFSYRIGGPEGIPTSLNRATPYISSVEAPDDATFVVNYKAAYYLGAALGPFVFWPLPRHLLGDAYERYQVSRNPDDVLNSPYWTTRYVHLGPFRLTSFDPGHELTFEAYDGYFLGRPKLDVIHVRIFGNENALFPSVLAGAVDLVPDYALLSEGGPQLKAQWSTSGDGTVYVKGGSLRILVPQMRPSFQLEGAVLDPRVRGAFLQALDREAISDAMNGGNPQLAAWSIIVPGDPLYEATRDGLRGYSFSPDRARAILAEAGWTPGADGMLRQTADGRPFRASLWPTVGFERGAAAYAAYWRQIGIDVEERAWTPAETREARLRSQFTGWDITGGGVLGLLEDVAGSTENNYTGNRNGYEDARAQQLIRTLKGTIAPAEQLDAARRVGEFFRAELPALPTFYLAAYYAARKGVKALDDGAGAISDSPSVYAYGSYSRNAYLWDVQ